MTLLVGMLFYYSTLGASESFWALLPGLLLGGVGMGLTMTPVTAAAMSAVPVDKAGVGSAVLNSADGIPEAQIAEWDGNGIGGHRSELGEAGGGVSVVTAAKNARISAKVRFSEATVVSPGLPAS